MTDEQVLAKHLRQLQAVPSEFRQLAEFGWNELRPRLEKEARKHGARPDQAARIAARLARLVVSQMYGDIMRCRTVDGYNG